MNILLIAQCEKKALTESRRILDQFAERRGDRTWQTAITEAGLDTLRKLLRKTARKNTAVACHWIRGRDHSELLWIVGDAGRFNAEGAVPTNTTVRNVLRREQENDWHTAEDIRLLAQLGALLHDLGKASVAFQQRLRGELNERNRYRHEWVSLRLFLAFVGSDDDEGWLRRLSTVEVSDGSEWTAAGRYQRDGVDATERYPFRKLPDMAAAVAWLVVTHHRLPVIPSNRADGSQARLGQRTGRFDRTWLETPLADVAHDWNELRPEAASQQKSEPYWQLAGPLPVISPKWRAQATRLANGLLALCRRRREGQWLGNPFVMHLARLSLMLADHHYSSLGLDENDQPLLERQRFLHPGESVAANTTRNRAGGAVINQSLVEHLLGVGHAAGVIAHALPGFERHLPRLARHRGLRKRSADPGFAWQDKVADAATGLRASACDHGAFVINMASTGCGKTLANARILYALSDPQLGLRATYALGLRTLTLQTGRSYRHDLHLGEDELAVLVGGSASRSLFEYYEQKAEASGSASKQSLLEEDSHVLYEGNIGDHPLLSRALADGDIRRLLAAPMLVCTVDHLTPATESLRAGRQIAPMLRLMSADLVLDELDDYDLNDLPALTRLVHWAGMLGTRVLLSSATLPPALVEGMFMAYRAGRRQYLRNRGRSPDLDHALIEVPCLWTDEFGVQVHGCSDDIGFASMHDQFVRRRVTKLQATAPLRRAELLPLAITATQPERIRTEFARHVHQACLRLHQTHANVDPFTGKRVSFGLVRMANIEPIIDVACALHALGASEGTHIHLCVYHSRFPLAQRSAIEFMLDTTLNRRDAEAVWRHPSVRSVLDAYPEREHLFVVLASPVCEVGRDWDADWAVAEPSSMRSLIQLAGRVQRHRRIAGHSPNVLVFDTNLKHFESQRVDQPVYVRPGFEKPTEDGRFLLTSHSLGALLHEDEYQRLDAVPRIRPRPASERQPRLRWVDLEQARIEASLLPPPQAVAPASRRSATRDPSLERDQAAPAWQFPSAALTGVLQQQQPFREDDQPTTVLVFLPGDDEMLVAHRVEDDRARRGKRLYVDAEEMLRRIPFHSAAGIGPWGDFDLMHLLTEHAQVLERPLDETAPKLSTLEVPRSELGWWRWHRWLGFGEGK